VSVDDFRIRHTPTFARDLQRVTDFMVERELASSTPDVDVVSRFADALERGLGLLAFAPHSCRRCEEGPAFRELLVPFGKSGCVVLFAIEDRDVVLLALRNQLEHDYSR
jgi:hypothetical protein